MRSGGGGIPVGVGGVSRTGGGAIPSGNPSLPSLPSQQSLIGLLPPFLSQQSNWPIPHLHFPLQFPQHQQFSPAATMLPPILPAELLQQIMNQTGRGTVLQESLLNSDGQIMAQPQFQTLLGLVTNAMTASGISPLALMQQALQALSQQQTVVPPKPACTTSQNEDLDDSGNSGDEEDSPLDLSKKRRSPKKVDSDSSENIDVVGSSSDSPSEKADSSSNSDPGDMDGSSRSPNGGKRNYSQVELDAAVGDIRAGKLGTRRASVVYGIPRSTLRNKIYKLESSGDLGKRVIPVRRKRLHQGDDKRGDGTPDCSISSSRSGSTENSDTSTSASVSETSKKTGSGDMGTGMGVEDWTKGFWNSLVAAHQFKAVMPNPPLPPPPARKATAELNCAEWKRARPKRGQYRKYDKEALEKAVRSVRLGEMSVHRAGSYYGVPHSTLEYKVKERNLTPKKCASTSSRSVDEPQPENPCKIENSREDEAADTPSSGDNGNSSTD